MPPNGQPLLLSTRQTSEQDQIAFFKSLICTGAGRNPATCGTNQSNSKCDLIPLWGLWYTECILNENRNPQPPLSSLRCTIRPDFWGRFAAKDPHTQHANFELVWYRGTSLIRNFLLLGPYRRHMPCALRRSYGGGQFLTSEVSLYRGRSYRTPHRTGSHFGVCP